MGYRGKLREQQQARLLRSRGLPLAEIPSRLGVSQSSVSVWGRDVAYDPLPRVTRVRLRGPKAQQRRRHAEIYLLLDEWRALVGKLSES
jgi:hypothetical protein